MKLLKERDSEIGELHQEVKALKSENSFLINSMQILIDDKISIKSEASDKIESLETELKQAQATISIRRQDLDKKRTYLLKKVSALKDKISRQEQ